MITINSSPNKNLSFELNKNKYKIIIDSKELETIGGPWPKIFGGHNT